MARTPQSPPDRAAERFHEERATFAVRGTDQPDLASGVDAIREVVRTLKPRPGVYRMQDARGDVLYVGKARALKNRVANYVQVERLSNRLRRMVSQTRSMTIVTTNSEAEALLLPSEQYLLEKRGLKAQTVSTARRRLVMLYERWGKDSLARRWRMGLDSSLSAGVS